MNKHINGSTWWCFAFLIVIGANGGCRSKSAGVTSMTTTTASPRTDKQTGTTTSSAKTSDWKPDAALKETLTQKVDVDKYQLALPPEFTPLKPRPKGRENVTIEAWGGKRMSKGEGTLLTVIINARKAAVDEAKENLSDFLVNFSTAATETAGIQNVQRDATEKGTLVGIHFLRFKWSGKNRDNIEVQGLFYVAIDDVQVIAIQAIATGANAETERKLLESSIATLTKR